MLISTGKCVGYECCGGKNYVSLYSSKSLQEKDEAEQRGNTGSLNIQGCFSDSVSNVLKRTKTLKREDSENTLLRWKHMKRLRKINSLLFKFVEYAHALAPAT